MTREFFFFKPIPKFLYLTILIEELLDRMQQNKPVQGTSRVAVTVLTQSEKQRGAGESQAVVTSSVSPKGKKHPQVV